MNLDLAGYHLTYDQEFTDGTPFSVTWDGTVEFKDQFDWGGRSNPGNGEAQYYSDPGYGVNPFKMAGGVLTITAANTPPGFSQAGGLPYTSGLITTQETFSQHGGYFEIRAKVPGNPGLWPAFWLLPTNAQDYPELDVMEDPNIRPKDQYWVHATGTADGGGGYVQTHRTIAGGYHTYGMEWNDNTVTFYFDHVAIGECGTPPDMAGLPMYMLINLAVGAPGSWPGAPAASSIPANYKIDYIRVFSNNPNDPPAVMQPISSPDGADTTPVLAAVPPPTIVTGTGPQSLLLQVNEDYFQADATFRVAIDGVEQGGIFTTVAPKGQGLIQEFVFNGTFTPGAHTLTVRFLNNVNYGPYFQRNLYVQDAALNGQGLPNIAMTFTATGAQQASFVVPD